jgi:exonuclease SbcD
VLDIIDISDVHIYNKIYTLHTSGASFTLVPFRDRRSLNADSLSEAMETIERCLPYELGDIPSGNEKVLVGHLAMEKSMYTDEIDDVSNEIMVPLSLFAGYQYVWMGHVHKPQIMSKVPYVAHIGSMDTSDFGETDQQKIVVLFDPASSTKFEEIIIPTRPLKRIRLDIPKDQDPTKYLVNYINTMDFRNSLVKLEISILDPDAPELDRSQIQALLASLGAYHISGFSESRHIAVIPEEKRHIDNSAIEPKVAVRLWAGLQDIPDDEKEDVITVCNEIIEEIQLNKKN